MAVDHFERPMGDATMTVVHHTAIRVRDVEQSLRFWRDGMGFDVLMDQRFSGDWPTLLRAPTTGLRSLFLGNATHPDSGIVELVDLGPVESPRPEEGEPPAGFLLISVMTDVDAVLARLARLNLGGEPRRTQVAGVSMSTVVDPDGVVVELIEAVTSRSLQQMSPP